MIFARVILGTYSDQSTIIEHRWQADQHDQRELTDLEVLVQELHEIILNLESSQNWNFGGQTDIPTIKKYLSPIIKILVVRHSLDSFSDFRKLQNYDQVHWCIYALPCLNELMKLTPYQTE